VGAFGHVSAAAQSPQVDAGAVFRIFLKNGSALPSFGESAEVGDRVVFTLLVGSGDRQPTLQLMSLPRVVGLDADGVEITAQNGRYGPYLKKGTDSRSLDGEDQIFGITLDEALAIYAQPKQRGRAAAKPPLKELGPDPVSGRPMIIKDGRFGAYVTDGELNATLRRGDEIESITPERAAELLAEKRAKGPAPKKRAAKSPAKKAPAKKAAASTTAKKAAAKRPAAKKAAANAG